MASKITFRKTRAAWSGFGDHSAVVRSAGSYAIQLDGITQATVTGGGYDFMGGASWHVFDLEGKNVGLFSSRKEAAAFVARRVETYGSVVLPPEAIHRKRKS